MKRLTSLVIVLGGIFLSSSCGWASGFGVFTQGAAAAGQANAVVAHSVGASSVYFNPALITELDGTWLEVGSTAISVDRTVNLDSGSSAKADDSWKFPPSFYLTQEITPTFKFGLGLFFPFGLGTDWGDDFAGRYMANSGEILSLDINPVLSWRLTDRLAFAVGGSALYLDANLQKKLNQTAIYQLLGGEGTPVLPDIGQSFDADGWGVGYNFGLSYRLSERLNFGLAWRSPIDVNLEGSTTFSDVIEPLQPMLAETTGHADIRLPAQATAGVAWQVTERLVIETGVRWEDWSSTDQMEIELDRPILGESGEMVPRNWHSTLSYDIGGEYQLNEKLMLRAGYFYGKNAVPDATFEPLVADSDAHLFSIGGGWQQGNMSIDLAAAYEHHQDRSKTGAIDGQDDGAANGLYQADLWLFAMSLGYHF